MQHAKFTIDNEHFARCISHVALFSLSPDFLDISKHHRYNTHLTPRPPSLKGKGETSSVLPSPFRGGVGGGVSPLLSGEGPGEGCFDSESIYDKFQNERC